MQSREDDAALRVLFARAWALPREFGKCDTEFKLWLPADAMKEVEAISSALACTKGELGRYLVLREVYGAARTESINPFVRNITIDEPFQSGTVCPATPAPLHLRAVLHEVRA